MFGTRLELCFVTAICKFSTARRRISSSIFAVGRYLQSPDFHYAYLFLLGLKREFYIIRSSRCETSQTTLFKSTESLY